MESTAQLANTSLRQEEPIASNARQASTVMSQELLLLKVHALVATSAKVNQAHHNLQQVLPTEVNVFQANTAQKAQRGHFLVCLECIALIH